jgi:hypothetical protein
MKSMNRASGSFMFAIRLVLFSALTMLLFSAGLFAQQVTGRILGTVLDTSGAAVPNAQITITNQETGAVRTAVSNSDGSYIVPQVPAGKYTVEVVASGFGTSKLTGTEVTVATDDRLDVKLQVGSVAQNVTVTEEAPLVDTTSSSVGNLVDEQQVADLPLNGRNWTDLTLMQPGVNQVLISGMTGQNATLAGANGTIYSSNGGALRSNFMSLDGANMINMAGYNNSSVSATSLGVDGIKEYKVVTSLFGAQYGMTMGSQTTIVSKGGTNNWHGDFYDYLRNSSLDARNYYDQFNPSTGLSDIYPGHRLPPFKRNDFGAAGGGPIRKDKLFFYAVYEGIRERTGQSILGNTFPIGCFVDQNGVTQAKVPAIIGNKPGAGTSCVSSISGAITVNPLTLPLADLYPQPNGGAGAFNYSLPWVEPTTENYGQIRVDYTLSAADNAFVRFTADSTNEVIDPAFLGFVYPAKSSSDFATLGETHVFSPSVVNTARLSFSRTFVSLIGAGTNPVAPGTVLALDPAVGNITGSINPGSGVTAEGGQSTSSQIAQNLFTLSDDVFWSKGKHAFQFGTLINHYIDYPMQYQRASLGFGSLTNFFGGTNYSTYSFYTPNSQVASLAFTTNTYGWYAQDDYRVLPRVTVNLGLRYEFATVPVEPNPALAWSLRNAATDNTATQGKIFLNPSLHNFSPRIGFSWDVFGNGKMAIRGGGGRYFDVGDYGQFMLSQAQAGPPVVSSVTVPNTLANPVIPLTIPLTLPGNFVVSPRSAAYNMGQPSLYQWNLTVERTLPWNMALIVGYIGSRGLHYYQVREGNPTVNVGTSTAGLPVYGCWNATKTSSSPDQANGSCPTGFTGIGPKTNTSWNTDQQNSATGDAYYDALQVQVTKRISHGLQFQLSYTYAKNLDDGEGLTAREGAASSGQLVYNPGVYTPGLTQATDRGLTQFDIEQNVRANVIYHAPNILMGRGWAAPLHGWWFSSIISGQGGYPITPSLGSDRQLSNNVATVERPNLDASYNPGTVVTGDPSHWFNPTMFALPAAGNLGNVTRGQFWGPGLKNVDFSAVKDTKLRFLGEAGSVQFRLELFNILNHPNFSSPNASLWTSGTPGTAPAGQILPVGATCGAAPSTCATGAATTAASPLAALSTVGSVNSTVNTSRQIQVALKVVF